MIFSSIEDIVKDVKTVIRIEGKDEIRYELPNEHELVIQVLADVDDTLSICVERLDEYGNTIEVAQDDYSCSDKILTAMIENALML